VAELDLVVNFNDLLASRRREADVELHGSSNKTRLRTAAPALLPQQRRGVSQTTPLA
jgi:hypothetical protein